MPIAYRELYCPAHFGNSYEVMWPNEMREALAEAKGWGFNAYGDWFDLADLKSPWANPKNEYMLPQALWERKMASFQAANDLGLAVDLLITPNEVFIDQLSPELLADQSEPRYFGQLLCPSKAQAREIILSNYRHIFNDLYQQGIHLDSLAACPFDYGGCACSACQPWIVTFGKLFAEIHELAKRFFPGIQARLVGWWWTRDEHRWFKEWADAESPNRFVSLAAHILYGENAPDRSLVLPQRCAEHAFVHIGYADQAQPRDVYGPWGPVIAPIRLPATVAALEEMGIEGYVAYSEGVFDDLNKALLGGLSSGQFRDVDTLLAVYAERYFEAKGEEREAWATWLKQWGRPWEVDTVAARREYERLARNACPGWRLAQWEGKLRLFEDHAAVLRVAEWNVERSTAAERFFADREWLQRQVWGLGLVRHVLNDRYWPPSWLKEWEAYQRRFRECEPKRASPEA